MFRSVALAAVLLLLVAVLPAPARANARLTAVTPLDGGCVSGPVGPNVEAWDVLPGATYRVRLEGVTDCASGGTDASLNVLLMNSALGNTPRVATYVAPGVYEFTFEMPKNACDTTPIRYCTAGGNTPNTGLVVGRHDTGTSQAHLRAATFDGNCSHPSTIGCVTATVKSTWGGLKSSYR